MDVSAGTLERLSFDRVRQALAERASTYMGAELAQELGPGAGAAAALAMHERVAETVDGGALGLGGIEDVRPLLTRAREGASIDGRDILAVAYTLDAAATLRRSIVLSERPALSALAARIGSFDGVLRLVREQLDVDGNVRDDATPKLRDIRQRLNPLRSRIRERLSRLLEAHGDDVQEPLITLRRDRYVIPVKASNQSRVPGLALDRSYSGATVFLEPASVVPLNNELALLELEERDEVRRILLALARRLADEPAVDESLEVVAEHVLLGQQRDVGYIRPHIPERVVDRRMAEHHRPRGQRCEDEPVALRESRQRHTRHERDCKHEDECSDAVCRVVRCRHFIETRKRERTGFEQPCEREAGDQPEQRRERARVELKRQRDAREAACR